MSAEGSGRMGAGPASGHPPLKGGMSGSMRIFEGSAYTIAEALRLAAE